MRHLNTLYDLSLAEVQDILLQTKEIKERFKNGERLPLFQGRMLTLLFEKPSLRTRTSFEAAAIQLGGGSTFLSMKDAGLNGREAFADVAKVLTSYSDAIVLRTFSQELIENFAVYSRCPVINGLSDDRHPCQALTDIFTMQEVFGTVKGKHLVYVGDGNNVAASLAIMTSMMEVPFTVACPAGYELSEEFLKELRSRIPTAQINHVRNPATAVKDADVVYTDVWASMGQEEEADERHLAFNGYQVNSDLMAAAPPGCKFMHDLPAKRGKEVTDQIMDSPQSIVFQQAENRMHLAKGLLAWLAAQS